MTMNGNGPNFPLFDLALLKEKDDNNRKRLCDGLLMASKTFGFFRVKSHGIPEEKIAELFEWSRKFFAMPITAKDKAKHPVRPFPHRGWSRIGQEQLSSISDHQKGERNPRMREDTKESFDQGSRTDPMFENIWPDTDDLPGFQSFMEEFYDLYHNVHLVLLGALERGLGLPESRLQSLCSQNQTELRLTHYPAVDVKDLKDGSRTRIARHTDFGSLTLLFQDSTGGLEVEDQTREGIFLPIESSCKSEMIVNVGDTLQNWTNQILRSANHQVTIPKSLKEKDQGVIEPRYSVAFFGKANRDVSLRCLEEFRSLRPPVNDEDLTTWEYNSRMVERTYPLSAATAVA